MNCILYIIKDLRRDKNMGNGNMGNCCCGGNNGNFLDSLFRNENTEILLFLVVFLLLFTTYGRNTTVL